MEENNLIPFVAQWMTIQPSLFVCLDDELGAPAGTTDVPVRLTFAPSGRFVKSHSNWRGGA